MTPKFDLKELVRECVNEMATETTDEGFIDTVKHLGTDIGNRVQNKVNTVKTNVTNKVNNIATGVKTAYNTAKVQGSKDEFERIEKNLTKNLEDAFREAYRVGIKAGFDAKYIARIFNSATQKLIVQLRGGKLTESEHAVKDATFSAKTALVKQRDEELKDKRDIFKKSKDQERLASTPDEKKNLKTATKDTADKVKAATLQKKAAEDERRAAAK